MKQATLTAIVDAYQDLGMDPVTVLTNYSGRGMLGDKTLAAVGPRDDIEAAIAHAIEVYSDPDCGTNAPGLVEALKAVRWDQFGKPDYVAY